MSRERAERAATQHAALLAAGGDIRGKQSAALLVVKGTSSVKRWQDEIFNLRVDDQAEPLKELRRLVALQALVSRKSADEANRGKVWMFVGEGALSRDSAREVASRTSR